MQALLPIVRTKWTEFDGADAFLLGQVLHWCGVLTQHVRVLYRILQISAGQQPAATGH